MNELTRTAAHNRVMSGWHRVTLATGDSGSVYRKPPGHGAHHRLTIPKRGLIDATKRNAPGSGDLSVRCLCGVRIRCYAQCSDFTFGVDVVPELNAGTVDNR